MRICGLDIETSGLDLKKDQILEIGYVIKNFGDGLWSQKNLAQGSYLLWDSEYPDPIPPEAYRVNKISSTLLKEVGEDPKVVFMQLANLMKRMKVEVIVAHNGLAFDKPFICAKTEFDIFEKLLWIDTKTHIQYPADCKNNNLLYLAAYHGFLNPFPHDALSDVQTMLRIVQHYDFEKLLRRASEAWVLVKADVKFDGRELARARGFQWNPGPKHWEKRLPESELKAEEKEAPFKFIRLQI